MKPRLSALLLLSLSAPVCLTVALPVLADSPKEITLEPAKPEVTRGNPVQSLPAPSDPVRLPETSPEHPKEATVAPTKPATVPAALPLTSTEKTEPAWDYRSIAEWRRIPSESVIKCIAYTPDGKLIAGGGDGKVFFWNEQGDLVRSFSSEPQTPAPKPANPDDDLLGQKKPEPPAAHKWVRLLSFSPDGRLLATAASDNTVKLWDPATGQLQRTLTGHDDLVTCLTWTPDGRALATGSLDKNIKLWNTANGQLLGTLARHVYAVRAVAFTKDLRTLVSVGAKGRGRKNGELKFWDVAGKGDLQQELTIDGVSPESVQLVADARIMAAGSDLVWPAVKLWDATEGKFVRNTTPQLANGLEVTSLAFTGDYRVVIGASQGGKRSYVWFWDVRTGKMLKQISAVPQNGVTFSPDGRVIAIAGADKSVQLWRVP